MKKFIGALTIAVVLAVTEQTALAAPDDRVGYEIQLTVKKGQSVGTVFDKLSEIAFKYKFKPPTQDDHTTWDNDKEIIESKRLIGKYGTDGNVTAPYHANGGWSTIVGWSKNNEQIISHYNDNNKKMYILAVGSKKDAKKIIKIIENTLNK